MALSNKAKRRGYEPLIITADLRCGVISDGLLPFDSLLYAAQHRLALAPRVASRPRDSAVDGPSNAGMLPLQVLNADTPQWYYAASCAVWPTVVADGIDHWTKRLDSQYVELLERQRARVATSGGRYRAYHMPVAYRHALTITWYAVGHRATIEALLPLVTHLGKKTAMGWGCVAAWRVAPHTDDWSVTGPHGECMRPVPAKAGVLYGVRPPYWHPRNQTICQVPGGRNGEEWRT